MNDIKVAIIDYETYKAMLLLCVFLPHTGEKFAFEVSYRKNDIYALVKFIKEGDYEYQVGYNNIDFDGQVSQFILDNYEKWTDLTGLEICSKVYDFTQELIDNQNYDIRPKYREKHMDFKQIDLFKIWHFDNKNRRVSLKFLEFSLDLDIETLPVMHNKETLEDWEIEKVIEYCWKDIFATYAFYKITRGNTEHPLFKNKDKIQLRFDIIQEFELSNECINWNDVKIGAELNKKFYKELSGKSEPQIWELKKQRKFKQFTFGDCFPKYWKFQTEEFNNFFKGIAKERVNIYGKQEFKLKTKDNIYTIAKGGGHTSDSCRKIVPLEDELILDADIASMYPNAIRKRKLFPSHLGIKWNEAYTSNIPKRLEAKKRYKETKDKKYDNLQETFKLSLNGSFGKLIDTYDWQYDPFAGMCVTIGSQIDIMMLVEMLSLDNGISIKSLNTDGVVCVVKKTSLDNYYKICAEWETIVGNDTLGKLEFTEYEYLIQTSVNDYLALKKGDEPIEERLKFKGDFLQDYEPNKNKSRRIVPIALKEYFVNGKLPEDTLKEHRNIFDFCIGVKATRDFYYEGVDRETGEVKKYDKLIRYYVSTQGEKLYKVRKEGVETKAPARRECEAGVPYQTLFNTAVKYSNFEDYKIDYDYYLDKIYRIIEKLEPEVAKKRHNDKNGILTLF